MKRKASEIVNDYLSNKSSENELIENLDVSPVSNQNAVKIFKVAELDKAKKILKEIDLSNKKLKAL